jgi:hypothetical protein
MLLDDIKLSNKKHLDIQKITAVWAFSEAVLGGMLHALSFPFTGLFIGSASVLFISLIGLNSQSYSQIIRSTLTVIVVKALVAPVSPLAAYFAVTLQGILGFTFFSLFGKKNITMVLLGLFSLLFSALQKIILTTILFGMLFWEAIDSFASFVTSQTPFIQEVGNISASLIIIIAYSLIHVIAGIYSGILAAKSDKWLATKIDPLILEDLRSTCDSYIIREDKERKKKIWWKRKSGVVVFLLLITIGSISYLAPSSTNVDVAELLLMIIRSIIITLAWFLFISPILVKYFNKYVQKKRFENAKDILNITSLFPYFKSVVTYAWKRNESMRGLRRVRYFLRDSFLFLLLTEDQFNV